MVWDRFSWEVLWRRKIRGPMTTAKMKWIRQLKVGDLVCDCRYKHVRIKELRPVYYPWMPFMVRKVIFSDFLPMRLTDALENAWEKLMRALHIMELHDYNVIGEDGSGCSAYNCLDKADHDESDHYHNSK